MKLYHTTFMLFMVGILLFASCHQKKQVSLVPDGYRAWQQTTDTELNYPIPGHENNYRIIYINATGENVQITPKKNRVFYEYPEGTMIVKEIYKGLGDPEKGTMPEQLTVMIKNARHPQARGGWIWIVKNMQTKEETVIDYEFCVDCHANANEPHPYGDKNPNGDFRDYVYFPPTHPLPSEEKGTSSSSPYDSHY
jgi:hypothetical protein